MKSLPLAFCAVSAALLATPAVAAVTTIGNNSAAGTCYQSAEARSRSPAAIAQCSAALNGDMLTGEDRVATHINRGIVLLLANRSSDAIRDFDTALKLNAAQPEAYLNKGIAYFQMGNSADAQVLANKALELRTSKPALAYYVRALAAEDRGDIRSAYADLRRAVAIAPNWNEPAAELQRYRVTR